MIVALGESIVVLGVGAAGAEVDGELALIALLSLALSASLWWTYFGEEKPIVHALASAPDAVRPRLGLKFSYYHGFMLLGVILVAAGLKKAIEHPLDPLEGFMAVLFAAGAALFVASDSALLRVLRIPGSPAQVAASVAALATIPLGLEVSAAAQVAALAAIVTAGGVAASKDARR